MVNTRRTIEVLYVDDEPALLSLGKIFLERDSDINVEVLPSAKCAIRAMEKKRYDVIISDYEMPEMNGMEFLKYINGNFLDKPPFIIFTGKGREEIAIEAINNGATFYLQKGGDPKPQFVELIHKIKQAVRKTRLEEKNKFIYSLTSEMAAENMSLQENLITIIESVSMILDVDCSYIALTDEDGTRLDYYASHGTINDNFKKMVLFPGSGLGWKVMVDHKGYIVNDYFSDTNIVHTRTVDLFVKSEGIVSAMAVPLQIKNKSFGVLYAFCRTERYFTDEDLETLSLFGNLTAIEIVKEKRIEQIEERGQYYKDFIDSLTQIVFEADENGLIKLINYSALKSYGYDRTDIEGKKIFDFLCNEEQEVARANLRKTIENNLVSVGNYRMLKKDGSLFFATLYCSTIKNKKGIRGIIIDNSVKYELERSLLRTKEKLKEVKDKLTQKVINELIIALGYVDILRDTKCNEKELDNFLEKISNALDGLEKEIKELGGLI